VGAAGAGEAEPLGASLDLAASLLSAGFASDEESELSELFGA
jgi:hypothetical protein